MRLLLAARAEQPSPLVSGGEFLSLRSTPPACVFLAKISMRLLLAARAEQPSPLVSGSEVSVAALHTACIVFSSLKFQCTCCLRLGQSNPRHLYLIINFYHCQEKCS